MHKSFFLIILSLILGQLSCLAQHTNSGKNLIFSLDFESSQNPKQIIGKLHKGVISETEKGVVYKNGIAKLTAGVNLFSAENLNIKNEATYWMRFMIPDNAGKAPKVTLLTTGEVEISADFKTEKDTFDINALLRNGENTIKTIPDLELELPVGLWMQIALTSHKLAEGETVYKLYYKAERSSFSSRDTKRNYWVYIGQIQAENLNKANGLTIGDSDKKAKVWVDEVQVYDQKMELIDLYEVSATNAGFEKISSAAPGTVIDYSPAYTGRYVAGSPSIIVLNDGTYLAKGDDYGPAVGDSELVRIYQSTDKGKTWKQIADLEGITWASLFQIKNSIYMLGTSAGHKKGHAIIIKSEDNGHTWSKATSTENGIIFNDLSYHTAPGPVVVHKGRIWRAMEDEKGVGGWGTNFRAFMLNADVNSDLLKAENWKMPDPLPSNQDWLKGKFHGWLEGNAVNAPNGKIVNMLRVSVLGGGGKAAIISYDEQGAKSHFNPDKDIIDFPGGSTKFFIQFDKKSNLYWALSNAVPEKHNGAAYSESLIRNSLVLMSSADLRKWEIEEVLLYHPDIAEHAFQYPTFDIDGKDLVFVSRTAYDDAFGGAIKQHDVNYFTFHRVSNFRNQKLRKVE